MVRKRKFCGPSILFFLLAGVEAFPGNAEIKGRITNQLTEAEYRSVDIIVTDRLGVELGRVHPNESGRFQIKISGPKYIIVKGALKGYPTVLYQMDTEEYAESTQDRAENKAFGEMRMPTFYQNVTFGPQSDLGSGDEVVSPLTWEALLAQEEPKAVEAYEKVRRKKESGDLKQAVQEMEKLVKKYPDFYIAYIDLGMTLASLGENARALETFETGRAMRPEHSWAYVGMGVALNNLQDFEGAVVPLQKAVELDPNSVNAQYQLGQALFKLGESERAIQCLQKVRELGPVFHPLTYKTLATLYAAKQDPTGAAEALEAYLTYFPDAPDAEKVKEILTKLKP